MAERREGRPEIVEGQADAELLESPQALLRSDGVDQQRALSELHDKEPGIEIGVL